MQLNTRILLHVYLDIEINHKLGKASRKQIALIES